MKRPLPRLLSLILTSLLLFGGTPHAAEETQEPGGMERAGKSIDEAATWTKDKAKQGWDATKEGAGKAADWTSEQAKKGAEATAEGAGKAADWTTDKAKQGWKSTKETSKSFWQKTKEFFTGDNDESQ